MTRPPCHLSTCCLTLLLILLAGTAPVRCAQAAAPPDQKAATQKKLAHVKQRIQALARAERATAGQRNAINTKLAHQADQLNAASKALRAAKAAVAANQKKLDALTKQRDALKASLAGQRAALADLLRAAYKIRPGSDLRLLLGDADVARLARALAYSRYFQHDRVAHIRHLLTQLDALQQVQKQIAQKHQTLATVRAQQQQRLAQLQDTRKQQQALLVKVQASLERQHGQMNQLKRNQRALTALLVKLSDVLADIPDHLGAAIPFAKRRGKLPWPVTGRVQRSNDGLHIRAKAGTVVRAVAHGRVAFANWMRGYGLLVIIDHGNGWMSLYGGNESLTTSVGDWVRAGQPIATAGASVGNDAGVYFGLRHDGKPVNPLAWLAKRH